MDGTIYRIIEDGVVTYKTRGLDRALVAELLKRYEGGTVRTSGCVVSFVFCGKDYKEKNGHREG